MQNDTDRFDLLGDLPRGRHRDDIGRPSNAYFESPQNLIATESLRFDAERNLQSKLFLGVAGGKVVTGPRLPDGRLSRWVEGGVPLGVSTDQHSLLIAGSRSGKGRAATIPLALSLPASTSMVLVDPKGEHARITARWRADGLGQEVSLLDPFGCSGEKTRRFCRVFNPLQILLRSGRRTLVPNAKLIADAIIVPGETKDPHWDNTAKQILAALCVHVVTHQNYAGMRDLVTVWKLASELATPDPDDPHRYWLEREMTESDAAGGMVRSAALNFYARTGGEFSSVLSNLNKHLEWIAIECIQETLRGDSIDLRDLKRSSLALYVSLPAMRMADLSGWLRLVVQLAIAAHEEEPHQTGHSTVLILEEFFALGGMRCLETAIGQIAGFGARMYVVLQDLNQLRANFPKNFETFIANAGLLQVFGGADQTTLEYCSKLLGQSLAITRSTNMPTFEQAAKHAATGESWSVATHPLMTAEEIGRYFARDDKKLRQLVIRPGYRPMILQRAYYDKHELFRGKFDER
ncbi:type IV secretory system conjugative DNA transfer family protein [Blastopirellula marina]|nr:type IV secretory system conjugative DNA transfer family protein [Blastopirellula marina]